MSTPIAGQVPIPTTVYAPGEIGKSIDGWTSSGDATLTFADLDRAGGGFQFGVDNTDDDCGTVNYGGESIDVNDVGTTFGLEAVFKGTEGNTNTANWFIGFSDVTGNTFFGNTGALASMDAIGFYKVEGSMFFRTCALNAAAQSGETTTTAYASATEYRLRIEGECGTTGITVRYYINEVLVDTVTGLAVSGQDPMHPVIAVANGSAHAETVDIYSYVPYCVPA